MNKDENELYHDNLKKVWELKIPSYGEIVWTFNQKEWELFCNELSLQSKDIPALRKLAEEKTILELENE